LAHRWQERELPLTLTFIDLGHQREGRPAPAFRIGTATDVPPILPATSDPTRAERLTRLQNSGQPAGAHIFLDERPAHAYGAPRSAAAEGGRVTSSWGRSALCASASCPPSS